ncbi:hypothetical protein [Mesorhizobium sp.]|uniref:hypothetical protein n=1 Tax=Mesorhizobium sp. TaxID=1871066 RepID=UPI002581086A|nr:hypothetical protein [Mesorhizobium sp.]
MRAKLVEPVDRSLIVGAILHPPLKDESDELATRHGNCRTNVCADTGRSQLHPHRITFNLFGCQEIFDLNEARRLYAAHTLYGVRDFQPSLATNSSNTDRRELPWTGEPSLNLPRTGESALNRKMAPVAEPERLPAASSVSPQSSGTKAAS